MKKALFVLPFLFLTSPLFAQRGAMTIPRNLADLVEQAERIIQGQVVLARVETHPEFENIQTVVVHVRVEETLKGDAEEFLTFRQFIWEARDRMDRAGYLKGQRVLLLLNRPTRYGLVSPAGLGQGRFRIFSGPDGEKYAVNAHANGALFADMDKALQERGIPLPSRLAQAVSISPRGPILLGDLTEIIRALVGK